MKTKTIFVRLVCAVAVYVVVLYNRYIGFIYSLQLLPVHLSTIRSPLSDTEKQNVHKSARLDGTSISTGDVRVSIRVQDHQTIINSTSAATCSSFPNYTREQNTSNPVQKLEEDFNPTFPMLQSYIMHRIWPVYNWTATDGKSLTNKTIMFHNKPDWIKPNGNQYFNNCEVSTCLLTSDTKWPQTADAIIYHMPWLKEVRPPEGRPPGQIWIAYGFESPVYHYSQYRNPGWKDVFNWTITYRQDSDLFHPYAMLTRRKGLLTRNFTQEALEKTKSVAWFVSNCHTQSKRDVYVKQMQQVISVDIFGRCGSQKMREDVQ
ncbi:uncharacterized protein LOC112562523 [Pomacea canaliculata]|uniref:uncharacterized protein LOC112562523 n=1 Tax=Pomacea canaliculata TaxID=400727 RepID=UPI000D730A85|nr:uncharacterized protein LOC112562523 [Pomacea canaliculata]